MNKEKKNETISVRVDWETKQLYHRLIKEYQKSGPELIKFLLENNISRGNDLARLNYIDNTYNQIDEIHKTVTEMYSMLDQYLTTQKEMIAKSKQEVISKDKYRPEKERLRKGLKNYMDKKAQHTDIFGNLKHYFDIENAKRKICEINNINYEDFSECLYKVENGVPISEVVSSFENDHD